MRPSPVLTSMSKDYHTLPHTSNRLKRQANTSWHTIWQHQLAALNYNDCPTISRIAIIVVRVKVSTQHFSDSLLSTIKGLPRHNPGSQAKANSFTLLFKGSNPPVSNLSFGGACPDNLSGHPLCRKIACPASSRWAGTSNGTTRGESNPNWPHINIGVVCGNKLRMLMPSRSQSSSIGSKDYFD